MHKLHFAHQLRGFAAVLVVFTHLFGTYFGSQELISQITFSKNIVINKPEWVHYFEFAYFNGPFGVALFFLISGFVIPFSLSNFTTTSFLVARFFRVIPAYFLAFILSMLVLAYSAYVWNEPFRYSLRAIITNSILLHSFIGVGTIDPVSWTLSIEIKFYLLMAVFGTYFTRKNFLYFALFLALILLYSLGMPYAQAKLPTRLWLIIYSFGFDLNYVLFMLIGVAFHQHYQNVISSMQLVLRSLFVFGIFALNWSIGPQKEQFPVVTNFYFYALIVFAFCYSGRQFFKPNRIIDFLADISYPIYITHSLLGYISLKLLMSEGIGFGPAICLVLTGIFFLSCLLHFLVEIPSNQFGKRLAIKLMQANTSITSGINTIKSKPESISK